MTMQAMTGKTEGKHSTLDEVLAMETGAQATVHGLVHTLRDLGDVRFALLRMPQGVLQCVLGAGEDVRDGDAVTVSGEAVRDERAPGGVELHAQRVKVLSRAAEAMPVPIGKNKMNLSLDTDLSLRFVTLRNLRKRAVFKIQEGIVRGFREALQKEGFTEIHSPKIVAQNAEGGANLFRMEYFGRRAYLAQSPQFYKQAMVPVYERVFEIGPVFRAEKSFTSKHTTEFSGFDLEFSYIESFRDVMKMEEELLTYALAKVKEAYGEDIERVFGVPVIVPTTPFPVIKLADLYAELEKEFGYKCPDGEEGDLTTEAEHLSYEWVKKKYGHEFLFITDYSAEKRAFYHMRDENGVPQGYDLIWRGVEITTGAQREHRYDVLQAQAREKGLDEDVKFYLEFFKYGCPPHGGFGLGIDRLTMLLVGESIKDAEFLFRGPNRLTP